MTITTLYKCFSVLNQHKQFEVIPLTIRGIFYETSRVLHYKIPFEQVNYEFICVMLDNETKGIAYLNNIQFNHSHIITEGDDYMPPDYIDPAPTIDNNAKHYCVELMDHEYNNQLIVLLNWIQNKPTCDIPTIANTVCRGLGGLMRLILDRKSVV